MNCLQIELLNTRVILLILNTLLTYLLNIHTYFFTNTSLLTFTGH